jgi:hypothetical protein
MIPTAITTETLSIMVNNVGHHRVERILMSELFYAIYATKMGQQGAAVTIKPSAPRDFEGIKIEVILNETVPPLC